MKNGSRFQKGSGVYNCTNCGRATRSTGHGDNEHLRQCVECYDILGYENVLQDNRPGSPDYINAEKQIAELTAACISKGGKL